MSKSAVALAVLVAALILGACEPPPQEGIPSLTQNEALDRAREDSRSAANSLDERLIALSEQSCDILRSNSRRVVAESARRFWMSEGWPNKEAKTMVLDGALIACPEIATKAVFE